jgi:Ni/Fe-hydrogenase subunit HybB-like protein
MDDASAWDGNWAWSLPLIVITIIFHVIGMVLINERVIRSRSMIARGRRFLVAFPMILGAATLLAILLHAAEATIWAFVSTKPWVRCLTASHQCSIL